jgi:hypothetical protein
VADSKATQGFIDFDAVPEEGASVREVVSFLLSPEARELRPLLVAQIVSGVDLFARDRLRRAYAALPTLAPRLPFLGALLPPPPAPPVFLPGVGLLPAEQFLERMAPPLSQSEQIDLVALVELAAGLLGVQPGDLETPSLQRLLGLLTNPSEQLRELADALQAVSDSRMNAAAARGVALEVVEQLAAKQAERAGVPVDTLFGPAMQFARSALNSRTQQEDATTEDGVEARRQRSRSPSPTAAARRSARPAVMGEHGARTQQSGDEDAVKVSVLEPVIVSA